MNPAISALLFYLFALAALVSAIGVIVLRNPVSSALSLALCFGFVAAIFFNMGAAFLGITQIIVYAGAILVLFLFIIMMLDVKSEDHTSGLLRHSVVGVLVAGMLAGMISSAALRLPGAVGGSCPWHAFTESLCSELCPAAASTDPSASELQASISAPAPYGGALPTLDPAKRGADAKLLGQNLFSHYNLTLVILGFALLAGCVGAVSVGRRLRRD